MPVKAWVFFFEQTKNQAETNLDCVSDRIDCARASRDCVGVPVLLSAGLRSVVFLGWPSTDVCGLVRDRFLYAHYFRAHCDRSGSDAVSHGELQTL